MMDSKNSKEMTLPPSSLGNTSTIRQQTRGECSQQQKADAPRSQGPFNALLESLHEHEESSQTIRRQIYNKEQEIRAQEETCKVQRQNLSALQCEIERVNHQISLEKTRKESFLSKFMKASQHVKDLYSEFNDMNKVLHRVNTEKDIIQTEFEKMGGAEIFNYINEKDEFLCSHTKLQQEEWEVKRRRNEAFNLDSERSFCASKQSMARELLESRQALTDEEIKISELEELVAFESKVFDDNNGNLNKMEEENKQELEEMKRELEDVVTRNKALEETLRSQKEEVDAAATESLSLKEDIAMFGERGKSLEWEINGLRSEIEVLLQREAEQILKDHKLKEKIEDANDRYSNGISEVNDLRNKLQEEEAIIQEDISALTEEIQKGSENYERMRVFHQKSLDELRARDNILLKELEILECNFHNVSEEIKLLDQDSYKIKQSNSNLENILFEVEEEIQALEKKSSTLAGTLSIERSDCPELERFIEETRESENKVVNDIQLEISQLKEEENRIQLELQSLDLSEKGLLEEIESQQKESDPYLDSLRKLNEETIRELQGRIHKLQKEAELAKENSEKTKSVLHCNLKNVEDVLLEKNSQLQKVKKMISEIERDQKKFDKELTILSEEKSLKEQITITLSDKVKDLTLELDSHISLEKGFSTKMEENKLKLDDVEGQIFQLNKELVEKEAEFSKLDAAYEREKQVVNQEMLRFRVTFENRSDEILLCKKEKNAWTEKIDAAESDIKALSVINFDCEKTCRELKSRLMGLDSEIKMLEENKSSLAIEKKAAETEASNAKRRVSNLREKINSRKTVKPKLLGKENVFKVPNTGNSSRTVTPVQDSVPASSSAICPSDVDKNNPRSILKVVSSPSPSLKKSVSFVNQDNSDGFDCDTSGSSIVMVPELVDMIYKSPSRRDQIIEEYQQKQRATKRKRGLPVEDGTPAKKIHSDDGYPEISSSTPEH